MMSFPSNLLSNQLALVTGASRGIGQGIALALAKAGAFVIGTATTQAGATKISQYFKDNALTGEGYILNINDIFSIHALMTEVKQRYGQVNILINNAAITQDNLMMRMKDEEWESVIQTNLTSVFHLSKVCIRDMIKARSGRIINIGSVVGSVGNAGQVNYCAAKAGLLGFSKALALEVGVRNITVNTIAPGFIATDMTNALTEDQKDNIFKRIPMQKMGMVEDIASAAVFLASPWASYITGQTLHVNGGMFMN